jgi:hypothetical protein
VAKKTTNRIEQQARVNREQAALLREAGRTEPADRLEKRATELESGKVTDQTDNALSLVRWALGRR